MVTLFLIILLASTMSDGCQGKTYHAFDSMLEKHDRLIVGNSPTSYFSNKKETDDFGNFLNYLIMWPAGFAWCFISGFTIAVFGGEGRSDVYL